MTRIILLLIIVGIIGLAVGYLIFARTSSGYVSIQVLISPSKNVLDELVKSVTGIKKMRQNILIQIPMSKRWPDHDFNINCVLFQLYMTAILEYDKALEDLTQGKRTDCGARGMTSEQVIRSLIMKRMHRLYYEKSTFHLTDSKSV